MPPFWRFWGVKLGVSPIAGMPERKGSYDVVYVRVTVKVGYARDQKWELLVHVYWLAFPGSLRDVS
jgi:hypothetical protein